jgi:hypothetical protein
MEGTGSGSQQENLAKKILKQLERNRRFGVFVSSAATLREVKA